MTLKEIIENHRPSKSLVQRPYIIAEAGVNHEAKIDLALRLIDDAKEGGANAIKFQTYRANTIASKSSPSYWDLSKESIDSQYKLFQKYDKFWKSEYEILARRCEQIDIEFLSTPFDIESARFLNDIMSVFKVSSSDLNNRPFIDHLCKFGKPIILSTGASYMWEVEQSVSWIQESGNSLALLHCILNYPTDDANANLAMIQALTRKFPDYIIGYSDHTLPKDMKVLEVATLLGARIIEKHFTYDKCLPGNDHYHAMDKEDLKRFHHRMDSLFELLGDSQRRPLPSEGISRVNARRSLVAGRYIPAGRTIEREDLTWKRPGTGIDPRDYNRVIGRVSRVDIEEDTVLTWGMLGD